MHAHLSGTAGTFALPEGITILGRSKDCQIRINDPRLSRHHARFIFDGSHLAVEEAGSTNGILVNTERVQQRVGLKQGDSVVCGPCLFTVHISAESPQSQPAQIGQHPQLPIAGELVPSPDDSSDPDTEDMRPIQESGLTSHVPRQVDAKIQAALSGSTQAVADANLIPDEFAHPTTSALAAHPPTPVPPGKNDQTPTVPGKPKVAVTPADLVKSDSLPPGTALQGRHLPIPTRIQRALAGILDGLQTLVLTSVVALPLLALGLCLALQQAGAVIDGDQPRFIAHADHPASFTDLVGLLWSSGVGRSCLLVRDLFLLDDRWPFMIFFVAATTALLAATVVVLVTLVAATVMHGAPRWHRRFGLEIVEEDTGYYLTWPRALLRWASFLTLCPLSPLGLYTRRGLHDALCRCLLIVRKR